MVATDTVEWRLGRGGLYLKSGEYSEKRQRARKPIETRWTGPTDFPRTDTASHKFIPALGALTTAIAKSAVAWSAVKRWKTGLEQDDPALMEVRRLCLERRREKELEKLRSDGKTERVEDLQGRTNIVHNHFKALHGSVARQRYVPCVF